MTKEETALDYRNNWKSRIMTPIDTHYDSLQVYYDFLEESDYETEELREFSSKVHWHYEYRYNGVDVGIGVGVIGRGRVGGVSFGGISGVGGGGFVVGSVGGGGGFVGSVGGRVGVGE